MAIDTPAEVALAQIVTAGTPRRYVACRCGWLRLDMSGSSVRGFGMPSECAECAIHGRRERLYAVLVTIERPHG